MSEQKLVSPLLDGFQMGDPISSHDGVRCCPAIKENSDHKYIIKILSIPASQSQLEALLLTGAFQDAAGALNYFKELADGVVREAQLHQQLARLEGFVPCEAWQVVPMDNNQLGYDVYLLTPYRRTLERHLKKNTMTHLEAVNLGLDLCAALAASRRAGFIYVDLKPSNIFISDDKEYLIGDLGFISMDSMKYAALPSKYRSAYSAPELHDVFATISKTADIYALGLILYQVYNDGQLPFETQPPAQELAPPANADYEMAEIILKACHPDPAQRWQDPAEMGQALVAYMQRNTINDVPIMPPVITGPAAEETEDTELPADETLESTEEAAEAARETGAQEESVGEEAAPAEEAPAEDADPDVDQEVLDILAEETAPDEETLQDVDPDLLSQETSEMLAQADELVAHEIPEPVVVPEAKLPEEEQPDPEPAAEETVTEASVTDGEENDDEEDDIDIPLAIPEIPRKKRGRKFLVTLVILLLLAGLGYCGNYFYQNYYLVPVESIVLDGDTDSITAQVSVSMDESILIAVCTDTYGNTTTAPVQGGKAEFTGLNPGTQYTVTLKVDGFFKLVGNNSASFTTTNQTNIVSISATTGAEDGSVILSFTVDGTDPQNWTVEYAAEGEEAQTMDFTGHMVTINGLTVGNTYTFRLMPTEETDVDVVGTDTLEFTVCKVILAENVAIGSFNDGLMTIQWNAPADTQVAEWTVRCTDADGYDQTLTVTDCTAQFSGVEVGKTYTLEILAAGMTQSVRADVSPKLLTVSNVACTPVGATTLRVTWEYEGDAPADGWVVSYSVAGGETKTMTTETNAADLSPVIPGVTYEVAVSGETASYQAPAAGKFSGYGVSGSDLASSFCQTPSSSGWDYTDVKKYTTDFTASQKISMVVYSNVPVQASDAEIQVLYVIRDPEGNIMPELAAVKTMNWKTMWKDRYFYPTVPNNPTEPGKYTLEIYFNGDLALSKRFVIN